MNLTTIYEDIDNALTLKGIDHATLANSPNMAGHTEASDVFFAVIRGNRENISQAQLEIKFFLSQELRRDLNKLTENVIKALENLPIRDGKRLKFESFEALEPNIGQWRAIITFTCLFNIISAIIENDDEQEPLVETIINEFSSII